MASWGLTLAQSRTKITLYAQDPNLVRWTAPVLTDVVNAAVANVAARTLCNLSSAAQSVTSGTAGYAIPSNCMGMRHIRAVYLDSKYLEPVAKERVHAHEVTGDEYASGYTRWYAKNEKVYLTPTPTASGTNNLVMYFASKPTVLVVTTDDATAIDLPADLLMAMVYLGAAEVLQADQHFSASDRSRALAEREMQRFIVSGGKWQEPAQKRLVHPDDIGYTRIQRAKIVD